MIQKTLVFVVDFTGKMIDGEKPVGFLRANDKNKNTIFLITPEQPTTQIKARFLAKTKHNDGVAVNGILTTDYKVNDLVSETKSYYEKIKDWNVFYFPVPERVVNYIASNAGSEIGITFEFVEWQLPRIKDIYGDFLGEITDRRFSIDANEDGYYVNRVIDYEYNGDKYGYNDLFIVGGGTITAIRAFPRTGGAVGGYFGVDPMYDSGVFEYVDGDDIDPSITTQIKNQVNNLTSEVYFLNVDNEKNKTDIATLKTQVSDINVDIVDLDNRVNDNASDIIDLGDDLNQLQENIDTEESARQQADGVLQGNIDLKADKATTYTKTENDNLLDNKADKATTILGIDLSDNILLGEFKAALGEATQSAAGLLSATDKARLDALHDLLEEDTSNNVVDSINEVLAIFNNYPEGVDIVTAFAGKVDKVAGYDLSKNDYSDAEKNKVALADSHRQITGNPHGTTFNQLNSKPTTIEGYGITDAYTKSYIDSLKDLNGWESELITLTPLTDGQSVTKATLQGFDNIKLFARNTSTNEIDTDSFDTALGLVDGYNYQMFDNADIHLTIGTDCTFTTTAGYELSIIGQKYTELSADKVSYGDDSNVEEALDSLLVPAYINATHEALQTEITATDTFEINDETGDVIKITGNEPTNLISNSELLIDSDSNGIPDGVVYDNATDISLTNGIAKFTAAAQYGRFRYPLTVLDTPIIYVFARFKADSKFVRLTNAQTSSIYHSGSGQFEFISLVETLISNNLDPQVNDTRSSGWTPIEVDYIGAYNVSDMIRQGVKNDSGIPFADLTNEEIKEQLDIWVNNGFISVIDKLVSKSDNLFNAEFNTLSSLDSENLVQNSDLLIDSDSNGIPDGFNILVANAISLSNGIFSFLGISNHTPRLTCNVTLVIGQTYYGYTRFKTDAVNKVRFNFGNSPFYFHSGNGSFEFISGVFTATKAYSFSVNDTRTSDWTPIEVDYIGAINITDLVSRGILPSGLTNNEYKEMIDKAMFANVPLRETNYISVEPSKAYKLIKASANEVTHKVIEYTTDNQVVKVTPVIYTTNKFTFTTHALTGKIKLVSDILERVPNLIKGGEYINDTTDWVFTGDLDADTTNGKITVTKLSASISLIRFGQLVDIKVGDEYYFYIGYIDKSAEITSLNLTTRASNFTHIDTIQSKLNYDSYSIVKTINADAEMFAFSIGGSEGGTVTIGDYHIYNIGKMKSSGVKNDSGTLFSRLTNDEIKDQMDIWVKTGFPDHVIAALYPNGVDSAIALKYNDADDVFRPQQIDELPLNLTLRSGEYWQDGYVVKQNGNAEYYPLDTKFSAWNYGQLEAVYTSGVPADFDIKYAQNASAQVKTTQEFLVEAREQLDYVTDGYDNLVEKLGDAILSDKYDSYAGITSDTYEYYTLEGIKEGNTLAIEGAGQSIQNLLGKNGTINATTTTRGITVTYDSVTGVFTANGTATAGRPFNITLATGMDFGLPVGTPMQLMRYYDDVDGGTVDLNSSYIGYVLLGGVASNRINENSEALYDPYINGSGNLNPPTNKQQVVFQVWAPGIVFTNFKFKIGIYEGLQLRPFILPSGEPAKSNVTVYNRTANKLNMSTALNVEDSGLVLTYDPLVQEFLLSGTATATKDISLSATFNALSGDRFSIKRLYQSGDITAAGGTLPRLKLVNSGGTAIVYNDIYKMTAPEGQTPTPDVSFNTGTAPADATLTLKLGITNGQVFDNYRFRLMIHDKSTDIGYVAYRRDSLGNMSVGANERAVIEFKAIPYGILEFVADSESLNLLFADGITDLNKTYLEYNAGIISPNRKISELTARAELIDNPFRNKVIAVWGDSRESNNPTSDPSGVGDQKDTSWPALLAKKLSATVLNFGLSGGAWAENTFQQDAASAIVNRVQTEDVSASADVIVISSMNDFKLASVLGSPLPANKDKTTFYGAMRLTYDRLATKYPGKKIVLVLPQKRYDEDVNYGGGSYYHYLKAQVEVAKEYGIPIVDLYHNLPNTKPLFYATNMLNDTHFSAVGNDRVAELVARELIGNGNKGDMDVIPPIPTTDGTYTLKVTITGGIPVFSWVA